MTGVATREQWTAELRKARTWILFVGLANFAVELFYLYVIWADQVDPGWRTTLTLVDSVILGFFVVLAAFARRWPVVCCALALAGFWALHAYLAIQRPTTLGEGFLLKVLFTFALVKGIQSAIRAQRLERELERVFG